MANDYVSIGRRDVGTNLLGVKVIHNGDPRCTKRVGWRGTVRGYYDKKGHESITVMYDNGTEQNYTIGWAVSNLLFKITTKEKSMSVEAKKGFIVWTPTGNSNPQVVHPSLPVAEAEAKRLASNNPSQQFYVAKLESVSAIQQVITTRL